MTQALRQMRHLDLLAYAHERFPDYEGWPKLGEMTRDALIAWIEARP